MVFVSEDYIKKIALQFDRLQSVVTFQNAAGLFDINKSSEKFFVGVLNKIYNLNLQDLNDIQNNYPAIDLGDTQRRICVQVTSVSSNSKFKKTVKIFKENKLTSFYDELWFLIISSTDKCSLTDKEIKTDVLNLQDLMSDVRKLNTNGLESLFNYIDSELNFQQNKKSILPSIINQSCNLDKPLAFIRFLDLNENDELVLNLISKDLKSLLKTLLNLSSNQREFIYYLVSNGAYNSNLRNVKNDWGAPLSVPTSQISQAFGESQGLNLFNSMIHYGIISLNREYEPNGDGYYMNAIEVHYFKDLEDTNYFNRIKLFCEYNDTMLREIIIDCNFSSLC